MSAKKKVLILCTGNSCRSQMAEGFWRWYGGDEWEVSSAGIAPTGLNPLAVAVMRELDIDISKQTSKSLEQLRSQEFDLVITVCGNADRNCPNFPAPIVKEHWPLDDPAAADGTAEARMSVFRRVRDKITTRVRAYLDR